MWRKISKLKTVEKKERAWALAGITELFHPVRYYYIGCLIASWLYFQPNNTN